MAASKGRGYTYINTYMSLQRAAPCRIALLYLWHWQHPPLAPLSVSLLNNAVAAIIPRAYHTHTHNTHTNTLARFVADHTKLFYAYICLLLLLLLFAAGLFIYVCNTKSVTLSPCFHFYFIRAARQLLPSSTQLNPAQLSSPPKNIPLMWKLCAARPALPCLMIVATTFIHQSITVIAICCYCCCLLTCCLHSTLICCRRMLSYVPSALVCVASLTQCQFRQRHHVSLTT